MVNTPGFSGKKPDIKQPGVVSFQSCFPQDPGQFCMLIDIAIGALKIHCIGCLMLFLGKMNSRIRTGYGAENFNVIRQIALNLLKKEASKLSIKRKRFVAGLDDFFREKVLFGL